MQYKSERNNVIFPIAEVLITRDDNDVITHMTVKIANSIFDHDFEDTTEIRIMNKVLTGKLSPYAGFKACCETHYSMGMDTNSYPSAIILRRILDNSKECKPFINGKIFDEIEPYLENKAPSRYNFTITL